MLRGTLIEGDDILRTYHDFELLRRSLISAFPCVFIPGIPDRNFLGDVEELLKEMKVKLLNHFLKKLMENKDLLNSEAIKIFTTPTKDYKNALRNFRREPYDVLLEKYKSSFKGYHEDYNISEGKAYLDKNYTVFTNTKKYLDMIGTQIEEQIFNIFNEQNNMNVIFEMFQKLESAIPNNKNTLSDLENLVVPLKNVSDK